MRDAIKVLATALSMFDGPDSAGSEPDSPAQVGPSTLLDERLMGHKASERLLRARELHRSHERADRAAPVRHAGKASGAKRSQAAAAICATPAGGGEAVSRGCVRTPARDTKRRRVVGSGLSRGYGTTQSAGYVDIFAMQPV